ncbi:hypothetical protein [Paenibacillus daejeonensis]|uniref:hypothetical protein n=1 Tax=Paenibacillus daejeonensis TaxID=135193 RepID=UPI000373A112|nr:hypothetical protein [Paenibacillus daejeonensis]
MNFLMYVGSAYGLLSEAFAEEAWPKLRNPEQVEDYAQLRNQWEEFWEQSTYVKANAKRENRDELIIDPPEFSRITQPDLKAALITLWPSFSAWWNMPAGGQVAMQYWDNQMDVLTIAQQYEAQVGRPMKPFQLHIDLVYTGLREPLEVNEQFVIMPLGTRFIMNNEWWMQKFIELG